MPRANLPAVPAAGPLLPASSIIPEHYVNPGLSLAQVASILWAYKRQTLLIAIAITALVAVVIKLMPKTYEASATLMVDYDVNDPLSGKEFPIGLLGSYMATQIELMRSDEVLIPVVNQLSQSAKSEYGKGYTGDPRDLPRWIARAISKKLIIEQGHYGSQLIYISFAANNASDAAQVANSIADVYLAQLYKRVTGPATETAKRYQAQLDDLKLNVSRAQDKVTEFHQRTGLLDSDSKIDIEMERLSTLQQRLLEAQYARRAAEAKGSENKSVAPEVLSSTLIQSLKAQLSAQNVRMAELRATLGPAHPQLLELQSQIDATRRSLAAEVGSYSSGAASDLNSTRQLENKLQIAVDAQHANMLDIRRLQDEGAKYKLDLESAQSIYKLALEGSDRIMFASSSHYTNTSVVSRAQPPLKPAKPKVLLDLVIGAIFGVLMGVLGPLSYELLLNRRVRCRDDLERDLKLPVLMQFGTVNPS